MSDEGKKSDEIYSPEDPTEETSVTEKEEVPAAKEEEKKKEETPDEERIRLEKEIEDLEKEKQAAEKAGNEDLEKKAEEIARSISQGVNSDDETAETKIKEERISPPRSPSPKISFFDLCLNNLIVGVCNVSVDSSGIYCGSCQKELVSDGVRQHIEGDGHKLNTLWNYDKSLAEVTGKLRQYPEKFEMEMFKHITMLNGMERRKQEVPPATEALIREIYSRNISIPAAPVEEQSEGVKVKEEEPESEVDQTPVITPEELAEIKAEFIASFPNSDDGLVVQEALMGGLSGYKSVKQAETALRVAGMLGKMICSYQRTNLDKGYKVNEESILDIKEQCARLLKLIEQGSH